MLRFSDSQSQPPIWKQDRELMNEFNQNPNLQSPNLENATLLDFWRWAFSDLRMNDVRGVYAEWMVAQLLGIDPPPRDSWDSCDLRTPDGKGIEVKSAAFVQAWETKQPSQIVFTGLRGRKWNPHTGYTEDRTCNADVYVFCLEIEMDREKWNALELDQWHFFVLPRSVIEERNARSIGIKPLRSLTKELMASELKSAVYAVLSASDH